ncbi:unnamed protein product [Discosporangium mesarthrocarpum]
MRKRLSALSQEQLELLDRLKKARLRLPTSQLQAKLREEERLSDLEHVRDVMSRIPQYVHKVRQLAHKKASLTLRVAALQRCSAELRQALPPRPAPLRKGQYREAAAAAAATATTAAAAAAAAPAADGAGEGGANAWAEGDLEEGAPPFRERGDLAYRVCYRGGVAIRSWPEVSAPSVGKVLECGEGIWATERLGRVGEEEVYVRLRDGRG